MRTRDGSVSADEMHSKVLAENSGSVAFLLQNGTTFCAITRSTRVAEPTVVALVRADKALRVHCTTMRRIEDEVLTRSVTGTPRVPM